MVYWKDVGRSKDLWSGVIFIALGCAAVVLGRNNPMGTAMRMGPAYFPTMLGLLLALIGLAVVARAIIKPGPPIGRIAFGKPALVLAATVLFGLLLHSLGLAGALIMLVVLSAFASERFRWPVALALAVGLAIGSSIIFVYLLALPIPLLGTWFGG
jgi:hypothetical protein